MDGERHMNQLDCRLQHGRRGMVRAEIDVPPTPPDPNWGPPAPQTPPAPPTPTDEPPPVPVQDPPAESEPKPPLTVDNHRRGRWLARTSNEARG